MDMSSHRDRSARRWSRGVPVGERGPGQSYRPENPPPSAFSGHQPGIATPTLDHAEILVFDLVEPSPPVARLLSDYTSCAESLMARNRREVTDATPAGALTLTLGLGASLFDRHLRSSRTRPTALRPLPSFPGDSIAPEECDGDLCVQVCAEDPRQLTEAHDELMALAAGRMTIRWRRRGSMVRPPSDPPRGRPRNLLGFKEATGNPRRGVELDRHVWAARGDRTWMAGGSYLVARFVRVDMERWQELPLAEQEAAIGRHRQSGAPLGRSHEFETLPLDDLPADSHVRLASARSNDGATVLRKGYSHRAETDADDDGLLLLFYQRDPRRGFLPIQRRLSEADALNRYTETLSSGVFALPPGASTGGYLAEPLLR